MWQTSSIAAGTGALAAIMGCPCDIALVRMQVTHPLARSLTRLRSDAE
jgi:hypothetical protein